MSKTMTWWGQRGGADSGLRLCQVCSDWATWPPGREGGARVSSPFWALTKGVLRARAQSQQPPGLTRPWGWEGEESKLDS